MTDYARINYVYRQHHRRFVAHVERHGLLCQECGGRGSEYYTSYGEPPEPCGWCETTGKVTRWLRGQWLHMRRAEKRAKKAKAAA